MSRRPVLRVTGVAAVVLVVAACGPVFPLDPELDARIITRDGEDRYGIQIADGVTTATAAEANTGGNGRYMFWRKADPDGADQETCATWVDNTTHTQQQGAALRARAVGEDDVKAITITKNVAYGYFWVFYVHVMDSSLEQPYTLIGQFSLDDVFFRPGQPFNVEPYPWRLCARVVGEVVSFKVWPLTHPEPAWNDPAYGGSATLPAGWNHPGRPGWYVGHLLPGETVGFTDMTTAEVAAPTAAPLPTDIPLAP